MMHIDPKSTAPVDPEVTRILEELRPLADKIYPVISAYDPKGAIHTRLGTIEVFPETMTPAAWSGSGGAISRAMQKLAVEMGLLKPSEQPAFISVFYGCCATNVGAYLQMNRRLPGAPWLPWTSSAKAVVQAYADPIVGWAPPESLGGWLTDCWMRLRYGHKMRAVAAELEAGVGPGEAALAKAEAEVAAFDFGALDAAALLEELKKPSLGAPLVRLHSGVTVLVGSAYLKLAHAIARWTDLPAIGTANALLVALGDVESAKPAKALRAVAVHVRAAPRLADLLRAGDYDAFAKALAAPADDAERRVAEARGQFLKDYGYRGIGESSLDATTWAEDPAQADGLLALYLDDSEDRALGAGADQREAVERKVLERLSPGQRAKMARYIADAQKFAAMRERTKSLSVRQSLRTRRIMRALIARLLEMGVFVGADDREMLTFKEFISVLKMERAELQALIARRRKLYELMCKLDIVEETFLGDATPKLRGQGGAGVAEPGTVLKGLGISPGRMEGIACVVSEHGQAGGMKPGEILVAPYTDAAWSPLFLLASAVVIDSATLVSHGATVARELGLPGVANVPGVHSIMTGDRILVDADSGEVTILERGQRAATAEAVAAPESTIMLWGEEFAVLRALRLKGLAAPEGLTANTGLSESKVEALLKQAASSGFAAPGGAGWSLTPAGVDAVSAALERERPGQVGAEHVHERFLPINAAFKQLAFDWQMKDAQTPNDHADTAYDAAIFSRLDALHADVTPLVAEAAQMAPRLSPYITRLESAAAALKGGDIRFLTSPRVDSYHTVWFEFHEELIAMTGRTRAAEAAAGRAA